MPLVTLDISQIRHSVEIWHLFCHSEFTCNQFLRVCSLKNCYSDSFDTWILSLVIFFKAEIDWKWRFRTSKTFKIAPFWTLQFAKVDFTYNLSGWEITRNQNVMSKIGEKLPILRTICAQNFWNWKIVKGWYPKTTLFHVILTLKKLKNCANLTLFILCLQIIQNSEKDVSRNENKIGTYWGQRTFFLWKEN